MRRSQAKGGPRSAQKSMAKVVVVKQTVNIGAPDKASLTYGAVRENTVHTLSFDLCQDARSADARLAKMNLVAAEDTGTHRLSKHSINLEPAGDSAGDLLGPQHSAKRKKSKAWTLTSLAGTLGSSRIIDSFAEHLHPAAQAHQPKL